MFKFYGKSEVCPHRWQPSVKDKMEGEEMGITKFGSEYYDPSWVFPSTQTQQHKVFKWDLFDLSMYKKLCIETKVGFWPEPYLFLHCFLELELIATNTTQRGILTSQSTKPLWSKSGFPHKLSAPTKSMYCGTVENEEKSMSKTSNK